jgi:4-hydroxybenzoyl-CoA thioesterase
VIAYERPVRFEDVDAAGIVFFGRFMGYCHEAMEHLFSALDGGYVALIVVRRVGLPAVHLECDFRTPLRYGDVALIETTSPKIGSTSATLRYEIYRKADRAHVASIAHVVVATDLDGVTKRTLPDDVRAVLLAHSPG